MAVGTGGNVPPYGTAIADALSDPNTAIEQLNALRDSGRRRLAEQGDLKAALARLEAEIERRGG